ncbi:hypothetical protein CC85DRAFT_303448 [Cutaneotrichosporon oleaginosum]|uniref:Uncharacterized protein n=1 Tax=Cutaneotrichosporon oleaginosum TaxID=879819 RepID=A0A0J0XJM5_9TREE|nr:uncharacterized protein CC85DRAFT_303448 [Cutaneotrichosporon oleaginosum]KLT41256.1 hypothetical protein CC85DRAFT_303448 [Cutaneotrichosporon oleaginosum]TXT05518.1 hypothetical protein COLE_06838 [Cutaneotrichosporon oleaginosum]
MPRPPLSISLPQHPLSPSSSVESEPKEVPVHRPVARRLSQPLSPSPTPLRAPSPIRRPSNPSPHRERTSRSLDMRELRNALPDSEGTAPPDSEQPDALASEGTPPPSPPHTPQARSRSRPRAPLAFFDEHFGRRGSLPLATPRPDPPQPEPLDELPTVPLDTLRAMATAGADFAHFPTVSFHPTGGGGKHTIIYRTVPGGVFGPDLAARLVAHLAAEPLLSPWLSPRASPSLLPLALVPDEPAPVLGPTSASNGTSQAPASSRLHSRASSISGIPPMPKTPGMPPLTPPPLTLPLSVTSPTTRRMPEAWWAGGPSVRAAAWAALLDDDVDAPPARITWLPSGAFGIAREVTSPLSQPRNSFDWSVLTTPVTETSAKGLHTFAFLPPFNEEESDTLHTLLRPSSSSRDSRSAAPSPDTIPCSPAVSELSLDPKSAPVSPLLPPHASGSSTSASEQASSDSSHKDGSAASASVQPPQTSAKPLPIPAQIPVQTQPKTAPSPTAPGLASPPTQARRNTLSLFGLSPRKARKG